VILRIILRPRRERANHSV